MPRLRAADARLPAQGPNQTPTSTQVKPSALEWAQAHPVEWIERVLGHDLWDRQKQMVTLMRDCEQVAVKACHSSSKTYTAAEIALWHAYNHPDSITITTAPGGRQVRENMWGELSRAWNRARYRLGGEMLADSCRLKIGPRWGIIGFATDEPERFSGFHAPYVLVIVDEASGVEEHIFEALEGVRSGGTRVRLLLLSQGTRPAGTFYNAFHKDRAEWECVTISAEDTPNFVPSLLSEWRGQGEPSDFPWPAPYLISPLWVDRIRRQYGEDSDFYRVRVLGDFPSGDPYALIPLHLIEAAMNRELPPSTDERTWAGLDVARFGNDDSLVIIRRGPQVLYAESRHGQDTVAVAGWAAEVGRRFGVTDINVDEVGVGGGPMDMLRHQGGFRVHGINAGANPSDRERFVRKRDEMLVGLKERFAEGDVSLVALTHDMQERLIPELGGLKWRYTPANKMEVESKDAYKQRLGHSPDAADALMLAFAQPSDELAIYAGNDDSDVDWFA